MNLGVHPQSEAALIEDRPYRLSEVQYYAIAESGILPKEARTYLDDGVLVENIKEADDDPPYLISTDQYLAMVEAGIFPEHARVYLRDGRIVEKMAKTKAHSFVGSSVGEALYRHMPPGWQLFPEAEFTIDAGSTCVPDYAVARVLDRKSRFRDGNPLLASEIGLLVEIAVSSLARDLGPNLRRYAQAGIPSYWVVDVAGGRILVHSQPGIINGQPGYAQVLTSKAGDNIPLVLDGQEVAQLSYDALMP